VAKIETAKEKRREKEGESVCVCVLRPVRELALRWLLLKKMSNTYYRRSREGRDILDAGDLAKIARDREKEGESG